MSSESFSSFKRSYHPMLVVLFHLRLLDKNVLREIPYSTQAYWMHQQQQDQFGYERVREFMDVNLDIRAVHESRLLRKVFRFVCRMYNGYRKVHRLISVPSQIRNEVRTAITETVSRLAQHVSAPVAARVMNISAQQYYRWKSQTACRLSRIKKCFRSVTQQLSLREIQVIDKAINCPENFGRNKLSVYYPLLIAGKISCSLSTFYEHSKDAKWHKPKPPVVREPLRASRLFQYLHVDITELVCENGKVLVAFVKDNFSKAILGYKIVPDKRSAHIRDLFAEVFEKFRLREYPERISIVSDGGPENKGELLVWIAQQVILEVKKLTTGVDVKSNSMSESVHHILKKEFLRYVPPKDPVAALEKFVHYHNHERYPAEHFGYTCWQVLMGAVPDRARFRQQMAEGRRKRIEENRKFACMKDSICKKD